MTVTEECTEGTGTVSSAGHSRCKYGKMRTSIAFSHLAICLRFPFYAAGLIYPSHAFSPCHLLSLPPSLPFSLSIQPLFLSFPQESSVGPLLPGGTQDCHLRGPARLEVHTAETGGTYVITILKI